METVNVAKVAVSAAPYAIDKPYDYAIPDALAGTGGAGRPRHRPLWPGQQAAREGVVMAVVHRGVKRRH